ncbi:MAG TPA: DNA repair protein RecN [Syntrophorhabdaceae bacterium]|nr:DNA repair protein RecN [Syntrophorhabdaceae bacterium]HOL06183.1 DNA repair protein RecN [Syntrophorhabdaceae bacterium]HON84786.1 DNA repair protein RecN [Syntrophorhabdaceae bacterium]HOT41826.1 DNA repair protein RecN [Syntrophorhabdaceae bacterium]HPC66364.1 DNA repair protein RecN [Syntrophorhabdaceae bacterium]
MLAYLRVKGFAIIDEIEVDFDEGFNVITGETGAGKSILINALSTFLNQKISPDILKTSAKQAEIVAHFLENGEEYILKRIIHASGRSRAYLNAEPVTLNRMEELGNNFLHIYGQNEYRDLLEKDRYINLIDRIAGLDEKRSSLSDKVRQLRELENRLRTMKKEAEGRANEIAFLEFQVNEIEGADLKDGEEDALKERLKVLKDAERIKTILNEIGEQLYEREGSIHDILKSSVSTLKGFSHIDFLNRIRQRIDSISYEIEDVFRDIKEEEKGLAHDPDESKKIEDRLSRIFTIKDKYGKSLDEIKRYEEHARHRLLYLKELTDNIEVAQKNMDSLRKEVDDLADTISRERKNIAPEIERLVVDELKMLAMEKTEFSIEIKDKGVVEEDGRDEVDFLISTNPGEALKPLRRIASGGELSRIMLAIKKVMGGDEEKTLIFDEVDTGIGGMVADMVGQRLKSLSATHQIICITHLPQIAVYGDSHFLVEKKQMKDYTITDIKRLTDSERINEVARMLGGVEITEKTIQRSEEMLTNAKKGIR